MDNNKRKTQMQQVYEAFKEKPQTMMQVSVSTRILRPNICRYVGKWEKRNLITVVKKAKCPITKHEAKFYSTNPDLIPPPGQSEMFDPPPNPGPYQL